MIEINQIGSFRKGKTTTFDFENGSNYSLQE